MVWSSQRHRCDGAENKARKGMVAVVEIDHSYDGLVKRESWTTVHVGLVESAFRCGHAREFKGLQTWTMRWRRISVDTSRLLDPAIVMAALAERESDEFPSWEAALDWINDVRGGLKVTA